VTATSGRAISTLSSTGFWRAAIVILSPVVMRQSIVW
jgi:hypothetical protein